jgi:flagellar protein FlgJ
MSIGPADTPVYTDLNALTTLKRGAAQRDPAAIRRVAEQFESMFTRMMLKSMRDAVGTDPVFGSDQQKMYQEMADDQLSVQLSKGKGLGLADMLIRQLQKMGVQGAEAAAASRRSTASAQRMPTPVAAYSDTQEIGASRVSALKSDFINRMLPHAQQAAAQLGTDPRALIAQAALETNWGRDLPHDGAGRSSHNLFGIKAGGDWNGAAVAAATREFSDGAAGRTTAAFRAYATPGQSFQDYVALLRGNPRYAAALNTGSDIHAFASALQRGGYATDPDYVHKISSIAHAIRLPDAAATLFADNGRSPDLKLAATLPITPTTGTL